MQSPWEIDGETMKRECYVFDFALDRALKQISDYSCRLNPNGKVSPEKKVEEFINFLPVIAYDGSSMRQISASEILDYAMSGTSATLLARRWESALLVNVDNVTLSRLMANQEAMAALMKIEGFRSLNQDIETIINKSEKVKKARKEGTAENPAEKKKISDEEKEYKTLRKQIQEKLIKFATRIPIFMYLTDYREQTMIDVITNLEPDYFKKVTGLDTRDFELLMSLGVFNESLMNDAVYKFKRYEDSSLSYTGINRHAGEKVGLFSTVVDFDEMFADQQSSMEAPPADDGDMPENPFAFVAEEEEDGEEPPVPEKPAKKRGGRNGEVVVIHPAAAANRAPKAAAAVSSAAAKPAPAPAVPAAPPKPSFDVSSLSVGTAVLHKAFGVGTITAIDPDDIKFRYITVVFPDTEKRFQIPNVFLQGFLKLQ